MLNASDQGGASTPARPLVALLGHPELHSMFDRYAQEHGTPRFCVISVGTPGELVRLQGRQAPPLPTLEDKGDGILKADWIYKHQTARPAATVLLVPRSKAAGDPSSWAALVAQIDGVKGAGRIRGMRVVIAVVQPPGAGPLPEDRVVMMSKQAGVDRKCVVPFCPQDGPAAVQPLVTLACDQAVAFYAADVQSRLARYSQINLPSIDANLRAAFKLAVLAEMRGEWEGAVRLYREAYSYVPQTGIAGATPVQKFVEVRAVAELVHIRLLALLLALGQPVEAAAQVSEHLRMLKGVPLEPVPPGLQGNHLGWVEQQCADAARLLASSDVHGVPLPVEALPAQLFLAAAQAARERRRNAEGLAERRLGALPTLPGVVVEAEHLGRYKLQGGDRRLTDLEFERYLEAQERALPHSQTAIALLQAASAALRQQAKGARSPSRAACQVGLLLGEEYQKAGMVAEARRVLEEVALCYRRDRWPQPLWHALLLLKDCAAQQGDHAAQAAVSLEAAAVQGGAGVEERAALAGAALAVLTHDASGGADGSAAAPLHYVADAPASPWLTVFDMTAGFMHSQPRASGTVAASEPVPFGVALCSNLPIALPWKEAAAAFEDEQGSFEVPLEGEASSALQPGAWLKLSAVVTPRMSGSLKAAAVTLRFSPASSVTFHLPPLLQQGSKLAGSGLSSPIGPPTAPFTAGSGFQPGQLFLEVQPAHSQPLLELTVPAVWLVGEEAPLLLRIQAAERPMAGGSLTLSAMHRPSQSPLSLRLQGTDGPVQTLSVHSLAAGAAHDVQLHLPLDHPGEVVLRAELEYRAVGGGGRAEGGSVVTTAALPVALPLELDVAVMGPSRTHALLPPPPSLVPPMAALSLQPGSARPAPPRLHLPSGQPCVALLTLNSAAPCGLDIRGLTWEAPAEAPRLTPTPATKGAALAGSLLAAGDTHSAVFTLPPLEPEDFQGLGQLRVVWRRLEAAGQVVFSSAGGPPRNLEAAAQAATEGELVLQLPGAVVAPPHLTATAVCPPTAAAGAQVALHVQLRSGSTAAEEVCVSVGEPHGFLVAGPRLSTVVVPPGGVAAVSFCLVPYHCGVMRLPEVRLSDGRSGQVVEVTKGCTIYVAPALPAQ